MIEVSVDGKVFDLYFRMPMLCNYVLGSEKATILNEVTIESPEAKVKDFVIRCSNLFDMTKHTRNLSQWSPGVLSCLRSRNGGRPPRPLLFFLKDDSQNLTRLSHLCLAIAVLLNLLLFWGLDLPGDGADGAVPQVHPSMAPFTWLSGVLYLSLCWLQLGVVCLTYTPMDHERTWQDSQQSDARLKETFVALLGSLLLSLMPAVLGVRAVSCVLATTGVSSFFVTAAMWQHDWTHCPRNPVARLVATLYLSLRRQQIVRRLYLSVMAFMGVVKVEFCYTFLLLDVMFILERLQRIIKAVLIPLDLLALTMMVGVILMYEYAVVAFYYFRRDYTGSCSSMRDCTMTTIYLGLREDIGANLDSVDVKSDSWVGRVFFDLSFFILITTVLMNILFGIIVDTFGMLRDKAQDRDSYMKNKTFIASLERSVIDKAARAVGVVSGFDYLEKERQHCWNYMYFVFYLKYKDPIQFMGPETRISQLIQDEDISWLPIYLCSLKNNHHDHRHGEAQAG
mmetsp:Transcript_3049/g.9033  ORF Transcript_3049/g.9033 Transcript_3049/m.9033 type:complete len:509 (-) Transcript_3049:27-1553(-)